MTESDRVRWNDRYKTGAYVARSHPTALLEVNLNQLPRGRALDIACGRGRNAYFLAEQGYQVIGLDISDIAIDSCRSDPRCTQDTEFGAWDCDSNLPEKIGRFDLIVVIRYVNIALFKLLHTYLNPGGAILVEEHLRVDNPQNFSGPNSPHYRVPPGLLRKLFSNLEPVYEFEGMVDDPGGERSMLSQIIATKN